MRTALRKLGNSVTVIIPKAFLKQIGLEIGDNLDVSLDEDRIVLMPAKRHPRDGWAKAANSIAASGDDALVWPVFANSDDKDLQW